MIFLLGATGYVGQAFQRELTRRSISFRGISRVELDYTNFRVLLEALKTHRPRLVINAAGFTGRPNVDACEERRGETILGNVALAQTVAQACEVSGIRLGSVSSGCIYNGAKVEEEDGSWSIREDLNASELQKLLQTRSSRIRGFRESDAPNFTFAQNNCSFYSGAKALAEEVLRNFPGMYVWRLRIPFDEQDHARNYLTKIQRYPKVYQNWNSISHLGDFAAACVEIWEGDLPGGCYNIVNPGYVSAREAVTLIQKHLRPGWAPEFWRDDAEFYGTAAKARRSNCLLETEKLLRAGVKMRPLEEALGSALAQWKPAL
ncbi:MAG: sugar nucleotide-binding protein [Methylacidiphilales bacterium]|nr:sugar nucleotide-binding protein [Candidatus Methylacidiphilales bacterium]